MPRCTKRDDGAAGCVREAGHGARCKVREDPVAAYRSRGGATAHRRRPATSRSAILGRSLVELSAQIDEIERELAGTIDDAIGAVDRLKRRNAGLLKSLVDSRRELAAGDRADAHGPAGSIQQIGHLRMSPTRVPDALRVRAYLAGQQLELCLVHTFNLPTPLYHPIRKLKHHNLETKAAEKPGFETALPAG